MTYATAPVAADLGIREPFMAAVRRAVATIHTAAARANERRGYRLMLQNDKVLRDIGMTREQVLHALAEC